MMVTRADRCRSHFSRARLGALELFGVLAVLFGAACGGDASPRAAASADALGALAIPTLNTFDPRYVQIDACPDTLNGSATFGCALDANGNPLWGPDANLYLGNDPADASHSINRPNPNGAFTNATWIDWNDLTDVANHVQPDWQAAGKDPTAFPQSNECVGPAQVLAKMDLVNVGFSNNGDFAFIAVQRAGNSGDAGYYWVFTKLPPHMDLGAAPCSATQQRLTYDIQAGDVLLVGHYHPSSTLPLLQAFKAVPQSGPGGVTNYDAVSAIDYTNANLWSRDNTAVISVAVNETPTAVSTLLNGFGTDGMKNLVNPNGTTCKTPMACLDAETFAEAAVYSNFFTGGNACGVSFYASIITRSSGSGGTSPDLKDLAGPYKFNFGSAKVKATVTPSCDQKFGYEITSFQGLGGTEAAPSSCTWVLNGPGFPANFQFDTTCGGYLAQQLLQNANLNGSYTVRVTASGGSNCTDTSADMPVNVYPPLAASCSLTPTCNLSFGYADGFSGGSGNASYTWTFTPPAGATATPSSSTTASGTVTVGTGGVSYGAHLVITDQRADLPNQCTATCDKSTTPYAPVHVVLASSPASLTCSSANSNFDTTGTFTATASGGSGGYQYIWGGSGAGCSGTMCGVNDTNTCGDQSLSVQVQDAVCGLSNQPTGHYTKTTSVATSVSN
jgi:hypothetical protein